MILVFNPAAFKHGITEENIEAVMLTALVDELIEGFDNKYLVIGFDLNRNLIEVMYNLIGEDIANIFHAMKCSRTEGSQDFLRKLSERGYHADFN